MIEYIKTRAKQKSTWLGVPAMIDSVATASTETTGPSGRPE